MTETRISLKAKAQSIALISIAILGFALLLLAAVDHAYVGAMGSEKLPVALLVSGAVLLGASIIGALGMAFARLSARKN